MKELTNEQFELGLNLVLEALELDGVLALPGVMECVREALNNEAIAAYQEHRAENLSINCHYIMTGDGQYLTDHHTRDGELLIAASPCQDDEEIVADFYNHINAGFSPLDDTEFTDDEIKDAIRTMVEDLSDEDKYPDHLNWPDDGENYQEHSTVVYAYLSWSK